MSGTTAMMSQSHEKKIVTVSSRWAHGDHGGHGSRPNDHGSVTARRGHSSVTARSQLNHGIFSMITAQWRLGHSSITDQVTAGCDHFGHHELTVSSWWQSRWPIFFSWDAISQWRHIQNIMSFWNLEVDKLSLAMSKPWVNINWLL